MASENIVNDLRKKSTESILLTDNMQKLLSAINTSAEKGEYCIVFSCCNFPAEDTSSLIFGKSYELDNNEITALKYYGFGVGRYTRIAEEGFYDKVFKKANTLS